jgi:hypothetical protein
LGILRKIEVGERGKVNEALNDLNEKVNKFLKVYDVNDDNEIDVEELIDEREEFSKELGKVENIVEAIKELEEKVIDYKQGKLINDGKKLAEKSRELAEIKSDDRSI